MPRKLILMSELDFKKLYEECKKDLSYDRKQDGRIALLFIAVGIAAIFISGPVFGIFFGVFMFLLFRLRSYLTQIKPPLIYLVRLKEKRQTEWPGGKKTDPLDKSYNYYFDLEVVDAYTFNEKGKQESRTISPSISERILRPKIYSSLTPGNNAYLIYSATGTLLGISVNEKYESALRD